MAMSPSEKRAQIRMFERFLKEYDKDMKKGNLGGAVRMMHDMVGAAREFPGPGRVGYYEKVQERFDAFKKANPSREDLADLVYHERELKELKRHKPGKGYERAAATASILGLIGALFFLSPNFTGNAVGNMTNSTSTWIGAGLFLIGLVSSIFYFKRK